MIACPSPLWPVAAGGGDLISALPIAHSGHWLVNLLYIVPIVIVVAMLGAAWIRDHRTAAADDEPAEGPPPPPAQTAADERAAP